MKAAAVWQTSADLEKLVARWKMVGFWTCHVRSLSSGGINLEVLFWIPTTDWLLVEDMGI